MLAVLFYKPISYVVFSNIRVSVKRHTQIKIDSFNTCTACHAGIYFINTVYKYLRKAKYYQRNDNTRLEKLVYKQLKNV